MPLVDYLEENPEGIHYIKILSQLAALNSNILNPSTHSRLTFQNDAHFDALLRKSVCHLPPDEARRRMFLVVSISFHGIADVCRASETTGISRTLQNRPAMFAQLALAIETLLAAPALA